jgi:hypothetical protein
MGWDLEKIRNDLEKRTTAILRTKFYDFTKMHFGFEN